MLQRKFGIVTASLLVVLAAGCQSERMSRLEPRQPEPLEPAPAGSVTASQLPPPGSASASAFPEAPGEEEQMAALDTEGQANAPEVTAGSVAGVWNVTIAGQDCRVATPQTKYGQGFRAGPLHCPPPMDGVKSWNVSGKNLAFYDAGGAQLAELYSTGSEGFSGQTSTGDRISLSR